MGSVPGIDWIGIAPPIALAVGVVLIVLLRSLVRGGERVYGLSLVLGILSIATAAAFLFRQWSDISDDGPYQTINGMVAVDGFSVFVSAVVLIATAGALLLSSRYLERHELEFRAEYVALMLCSAIGMLVMATANDLIVVFVALETLSIPLYVLAAFDRRRARSLEAGMKYFVLGAFASAVFLYGVALVYGATGTTSLPGIADFLATNNLVHEGTLMAGIVLLLVGLGFKIAAVPFHMWTPDVYEGAPSPVTAFMASATKAAAFAALLRVLLTSFDGYRTDWRPAIWGLAVLTLVVGNLAALAQRDVKRLLAYSAIANAGYILIGVEAGTARGVAASLFYLATYTFMVVGTLAVLVALGRRGERFDLDSFRGMASRQPVLSALLALFLLGQAGVPPTSGFIAKLEVFSAAAAADSYALLVVGVVTAVIGVAYYLRVVVVMYTGAATDEEAAALAPPAEGAVAVDTAKARVDPGTAIVLTVAAAVTVFVGLVPSALLELARDARLLF